MTFMSAALRQIATAHRAPDCFRFNTANARRTNHARIADPRFAKAGGLIFRDVTKRDAADAFAVSGHERAWNEARSNRRPTRRAWSSLIFRNSAREGVPVTRANDRRR
jgi:hypothetical protein